MEHIGHKIKKIDQLFRMRMDQNLEQLGVTFAQMHVLMYLFRNNNGEKITQKKLSECFEVKHSTMSGILNRLKEKDLIEIRVDEENKKYRNIYLTPKSQCLDQQMSLHINDIETLLMKDFTKKEMDQLAGYLDRLYNNLLTDCELSNKDIECFNKRISNVERRHKDD